MRIRTAAACFLVLALLAGSAGAQTTVSPVDSKMIVQPPTGSLYTVPSAYYVANLPMFELRLFFEFDLSAYGAAGAAVFNFSGYIVPGYSTGTLYLRPMTGGEDGSVTTGDWSLLGSPIWTGVISGTAYTSPQFFSVPVTSWFNARAGGFGGFALTSTTGTAASINAPGASLDYTAVPEPGTIALFGCGLLSLVIGHRVRRRRQK